MLLVLTVCYLALASVDVTVRPLQGDAIQGTLVAINEKELTLQTATGQRTFPAAELHQVRLPVPALTGIEQAPAMAIELVDDSLFPANSFVLERGQVRVKNLDGGESTLPPRLVRWVRFHKQEESVKRQWTEIVAGQRTADVLVVRKTSSTGADAGSTSGIVLDQLEGIVHEVNDTSVAFEYEGERIQVARAKLEGILFRPQASGELLDAVCRIKDTAGGVWNVRSLQSENNRVQFTTVAGATSQISLERLLEVDFSAANLVFLSDLEPETVEWRPYFQSPTTPRSLIQWFQPKRDQGADGLPLSLGGETYEKGLALHSRGLLTYRLTKKYQRLVATVGIEERYRATANLTLVVTGDDRILLTRAMKGTDEPFELELEIQNVRRLKILVDFGDDRSDAGDLLYLCNARLVK